MGGIRRPSFLKKQKEQKRLARANEKRELKRARKQAKIDGIAADAPEIPEEAALESTTESPADADGDFPADDTDKPQ